MQPKLHCIATVDVAQFPVSERDQSCVCRGVNVALSCQYSWNVSMSKLKAAATEGHQSRTVQLKTAFLMGLHSRWASCVKTV